MERSPSLEYNRSSASQEIPRILWDPKVHYRIHNARTCPYPEPYQSSPCSPSRTLQPRSIPRDKSQVRFPLLELYHTISPSSNPCEMFRNVSFYVEELLELRPTPKPDDRPL